MLRYVLLGVLGLLFAGNKFLNYLNITRKVPAVPETLQQYVDREKLQEAKAYQKALYRFGLFSSTFTFLLTFLLIASEGFGLLDSWIGTWGLPPIAHAVLFLGILFIGADLLSLPFDYYRNFVIEARFGFNTSTPKLFFTDALKGYLLSISVGGALLTALFYFIHAAGPAFWWQFWILATLFMLGVNTVYTSWILPLFNSLSPLPEGELREQILRYAQKVNFSIETIFVMDGSRRSKKANAFFSGFGKRKKVILYDTLIDQHPPHEVVAVLAHEVGHYKKRHILWQMALSILQTGLVLAVLRQVIYSETMSLALGGTATSVQLNIIGFTMLFSPLSGMIGVVQKILSRKFEFQADAYARDTFAGEPLAEALKTLSANTLTQLNPHPWYVWMHYSHPPLLARLQALEGEG